MPATDEHADLLETVDCPFCGSAEHRPETGRVPDGENHELVEPWKSMTFQMVRCSACGLVYQRTRPTREHIGVFYSSEYDCYDSLLERGFLVRNLAQASARKLVKRIEALRPAASNRLLDFGGGSGSWLELFRSVDAPWEYAGTEIDAELVAQMRAKGFEGEVADDSDVDQKFEPESFGMVWMHHVIEHVQDPLDLFRRLATLVVPGGLIFGQTPNHDCAERRMFEDAWLQWHLPRHLAIFDPRTLRAHAERAGLEVVEILSSPSGAVCWGGSFLKRRAIRRGRPYLVTREPLHPFLMLLFAPISVIQSKLSSTSHMDFILRRPLS